MKKLVHLLTLAFLLATCAAAKPVSTQLTVYNQGIGLVTETVAIPVLTGMSKVAISGVPQQIDPSSVILTGEHFTVLEQNFANAAAAPAIGSLEDEYLGKQVEVAITDPVTRKTEIETADLISLGSIYDKISKRWYGTGNPILKIDGKIYLDPPGRIIYPPLPEEQFSTSAGKNDSAAPSLNWLIQGDTAGNENATLSFITGGLTWKADYVAILSPDETRLDLTGWVTLSNESGGSYRDAKLRLVAGSVNVSNQPPYAMGAMARSEAAPPEQLQENPFFEYHLYTLDRPITLLNGQTKQIRLLGADGIQAAKYFIFDGAPTLDSYDYDSEDYRENPNVVRPVSNQSVEVQLEFLNVKENNLGVPLPQGQIRVYQPAGGGLVLIGEDQIGHTPKGEKVSLTMGDAFDLVGSRKQVSFREVIPHHVYDESFEIRLRNHKERPEDVNVMEHLWRWNGWKITSASQDYKTIDSRTIDFPVTVPANGEAAVTYTVRYKW